MNHTENNSSPVSSPPGDEFLQELMPKLGLEVTDPKDRYKNKAWARFYLPRVLLFCLAAMTVAVTVFLLLLPVRFRDVQFTEAFDQAALEFRVDRLPLFESVTATLDDHPLLVTQLDTDRYRVEAVRNGELTVVARTFTGRSTTVSVTVECVDDDAPFVDDQYLSDGYMYIYLSDGDGEDCSGVNWDSVRTTYMNSGEAVARTEVDESAGYVRFPFPDVSVRIYAEDNNGNPLSLRLDRLQRDD